jgi:hypothetical protein
MQRSYHKNHRAVITGDDDLTARLRVKGQVFALYDPVREQPQNSAACNRNKLPLPMASFCMLTHIIKKNPNNLPGRYFAMIARLINQNRSLTQVFRSKERNKFNDDYLALTEAHSEWLAARDFFEQATDPDLVDYAILSLKAAEKRYVYLWKRMREKEV